MLAQDSCVKAMAMLCGSEVTASTFQHLSVFSYPETIEKELGSFAPTLFNLIVKQKGQFPHIYILPLPLISV